MWRYGSNGHLSFATLGSIYLTNDATVQYLFGGTGLPPPTGMFVESRLRELLRLLDAVPGSGDPLAVIAAVNALQPLADRARRSSCATPLSHRARG